MRSVRNQGLLLFALLIGVAGCGAKQEGGDVPAPAASATASTSVTLPANLNQGPRAGDSKYDETKAKAGATLFKDKGCSACHAFGQRVTGPDLAGVSMRRTQAWLEYQILHPDVMVKQDPIARQMFAQFALQMPKQGLTPEEARAVIEHFKHTDHESGKGHEAGKEKH